MPRARSSCRTRRRRCSPGTPTCPPARRCTTPPRPRAGRRSRSGARLGVVVAGDVSRHRVRAPRAESPARRQRPRAPDRGGRAPAAGPVGRTRCCSTRRVSAPAPSRGIRMREDGSRREALERIAGIQAGAARARLADAVAPGGLLIYSTCSLEPEENERQVERFLARHPEFLREPSETFPPALLVGEGRHEVLPQRHEMDGAYAARLRRRVRIRRHTGTGLGRGADRTRSRPTTARRSLPGCHGRSVEALRPRLGARRPRGPHRLPALGLLDLARRGVRVGARRPAGAGATGGRGAGAARRSWASGSGWRASAPDPIVPAAARWSGRTRRPRW